MYASGYYEARWGADGWKTFYSLQEANEFAARMYCVGIIVIIRWVCCSSLAKHSAKWRTLATPRRP